MPPSSRKTASGSLSSTSTAPRRRPSRLRRCERFCGRCWTRPTIPCSCTATAAGYVSDYRSLFPDPGKVPGNKQLTYPQHRTGCIVGVLRKLYGWDLATVLSEYHSFANPKPRDTDIKYLTTVEPAKLFANAQEDAPMHARGPFSRLFSFALFATMIWFVTMYQIASKMSEKHHA